DIEIEAQKIPIDIVPSDDTDVHITYSDFIGENKKMDVLMENGVLTISSRSKAYTGNMAIALPVGCALDFNAFNTDFSLQDVSGDISIKTVDGDISAKNIEGSFVLRSGRGDITIADSQGDISIFGEHGNLTLNSLHGDIDASNVIGTIHFTGQVLEGDDIFLETDHGAVTAALLDSDHAFLKIWTANGTVTCMLSQVETTNITCNRDPFMPAGKFQIKTVWGAIRVDSGQ
ncbi:MAG: DUF4097 family beta strand repeat-containing protein, partial [Anaerolineaceae bacterium]